MLWRFFICLVCVAWWGALLFAGDGLKSNNPLLPLPFQLSPEELESEFGVGFGFLDYSRPITIVEGSVHPGVDFRVPAETAVFAVMGGEAKWVGKDDRNTGVTIEVTEPRLKGKVRRWKYVHIDYHSLSSELQQWQEPVEVEQGEYLGKVVKWTVEGLPPQIDVCDGKRFDHLHFELLVQEGNGPWIWTNPCKYLSYKDDVRPTIRAIYLVEDGKSIALANNAEIAGKIDLVIDAFDQTNGSILRGESNYAALREGNPFVLGIYKASVKIKSRPAGRTVARFDPPVLDYIEWTPVMGRKIAQKMFLPKIEVGGQMVQAIGDRTDRRSLLVLTNFRRGLWDVSGSWDTLKHPDGEYELEVIVEDVKGNRTVARKLVEVNNR